jgi:hypothetical protein
MATISILIEPIRTLRSSYVRKMTNSQLMHIDLNQRGRVRRARDNPISIFGCSILLPLALSISGRDLIGMVGCIRVTHPAASLIL